MNDFERDVENKRRLSVKICGLTELENIRAVLALEPDWIGFVFYPQSKRYVSSSFPWQLLPRSRVKRVGVFVNQDCKELEALIVRAELDAVQLHGDESISQIIQLRTAFPDLRIIKAISVVDSRSFERAVEYSALVDFLLLDTHCVEFGGSGRSFDWSLVVEHSPLIQRPFFLSGGLSITNLREAIKLAEQVSSLYGLDFNSKLESKPGVKSIALTAEVVGSLNAIY